MPHFLAVPFAFRLMTIWLTTFCPNVEGVGVQTRFLFAIGEDDAED